MRLMIGLITIIVLGLFNPVSSFAQRYLNSGNKVNVVPVEKVAIYFDRPLRDWDGFGVNYVETCQTRDYSLFKQDYSGFSFATEVSRNKILDLIFNEDGWKPGLTKLLLDPFHEGITKEGNDNNDPCQINLAGYDHETTTHWMRYFNREGNKRMKEWGGRLAAIATMYGPAPWMTKQKYVLGRDLDPAEKFEAAEYLVSWAKYLIEKESINVKYISFHNEGDAYYRWPRDGSNPGEDHRDYNMYWPPDQVVDFLKVSRRVLDTNGLKEVRISTGETQTLSRFDTWGYATAIVNDQAALDNLDLIASHSFVATKNPNSVYYGDYRSIGQDLIQSKKPKVKVWITSMPWSNNVQFIESIRRNIYECKANGLIPWAPIASDNQWLRENGSYSAGSMPSAFNINADGTLKILKAYYYYKQVCRVGQPGMKVSQVVSFDPGLGVIAFSKGNSEHANSFILINKTDQMKNVSIKIEGNTSTNFHAYRTSEEGEDYKHLGVFQFANNQLKYECPPQSVTTFTE